MDTSQADPNPTHASDTRGSGAAPKPFQRIPDGSLSLYGFGSSGALTVTDIPPWVTIINGQTAALTLTLTARNGTAGTATDYIAPLSAKGYPTGAVALIAATSGTFYYYYSEAPPVQSDGVTFQNYAGGVAAPVSGIWHFTAAQTVASTVGTVGNGTSTVGIASVQSTGAIASTTTNLYFAVPVTAGLTYTLTGLTIFGNGWIGPA
jgi:hypothetical protein